MLSQDLEKTLRAIVRDNLHDEELREVLLNAYSA
jgi:hypothetical protein